MATIDPLHEELIAIADSFALQVRSEDTGRASEALLSAAGDIAQFAATPGASEPRISRIAPLPDGPLLRVDELSSRIDTRRRTAEAVHRALADADLDVDVAVLPVDGLADLDRCRRAAVLRLFPSPAAAAGRLDPGWIDVAADWVFGDQRPDAPVRMRILGVERVVPAAEAAGILHGCAASGVWCDVVTGEVDNRIRTASISFGNAPHVAIAGGGPRCDDDGLLARFDLLREVARELADECAYACLDFEETFGDLGTGLSHTEWCAEAGAPANTVAGRLCDVYVPEVFPLQILGPRHVRALLAHDPDRTWGTPAGQDHRELVLGEPVDWLPTSDVRGDVRGDGWELLEPLLLRADALDEALEQATSPAPPTPPPTSSAHGLPDLDSIVIDPTRHARRGTRLTVLELCAWLAGEQHTDDPQSVAPVLRTFVRNLAIGIGHELRQELKPVAAAIVDTAPCTDHDERRRAWLLTDWLVRGHAPPWLARAGLSEAADRLDGLGPVTDQTELMRAVDLLGSAIVTAGRRLEITLEIAGDERRDVVDEIAWEIWEQAAERSGWIAASEAMQYEIPDDLAYATDQRVVECSRDPRIRAEVENRAGGLGDAIWSAALHEIASTAWRSAWEVIEAFVHHESTFSVRTTLQRSLQSDAAGGDAVSVEILLDEVDRVAHDALVRLVLDGTDRSERWRGVLDAISSGDAGRRWRRGVDETRQVLGPALFDEAVALARRELDQWIDRAPRLVGRTVASAVAREAAGVAGRAIAARAVAESMAHGGTAEEATAAARLAVAPVVEQLAADSFRILDALVLLDEIAR